MCLTVNLCLTANAAAQETASFMRNPVDTKELSLGGCNIVSTDNMSVFNGAVLLPFSEDKIAANASVMSWMKNLYEGGLTSWSASARYRLGVGGVAYAGFRSLQSPGIEKTDDYGNVLGESGSSMDFAVEAGYSQPFMEEFSASLTARYIRQNSGLETDNVTNALAFDAGVGWHHGFSKGIGDISAMLQVKNLGTVLSGAGNGSELPCSVNAAVSAGLLRSENHQVRAGVSADFFVTPSGSQTCAFGAEYSYNKKLYARAGWHLGDKSSGELRWASCGVGVHLYHINIDFGYVLASSTSPLHNTASCTIGIFF